MSRRQQPGLFDFGLDQAQEERARRLHEESIIIDMCFHGPVGAAVYSEQMLKQVTAEYERHRDPRKLATFVEELPVRMAAQGQLPAFREWWDISGVTAGTREVDMRSLPDATPTLAHLTLQFDSFDWLIKALSVEDIQRAKTEGKHAGIIAAQDSVAIGQNLHNLNLFHDFGLRVLQLTYNSMNFAGAGCTERTDAGLSTFGVQLIERMNDLGVVVDTGHSGRQTTLDAAGVSRDPVIASHTCAEGVFAHRRCKSDEELLAIGKSGGVIGIVTMPTFLSAAPEVTMEHFLDHVDYVAKLVGTEHVGVGTDWPMSWPEWVARLMAEEWAPQVGFAPEDRVPSTEMVEGFSDFREFLNITLGLVSRGYSDAEVQSILALNWLRVLERVWK